MKSKYRIIKEWDMYGGIEKYYYKIQKYHIKKFLWWEIYRGWSTLGWQQDTEPFAFREDYFDTPKEVKEGLKNFKKYGQYSIPNKIAHPTKIIKEVKHETSLVR